MVGGRRLTRSNTDRMVFGVAGGLAEYFEIDPVLVRVAFVLLTILNGIGLLGYVILAIVTPKAEPGAGTIGTGARLTGSATGGGGAGPGQQPTSGETVRQNVADMPREFEEAARRTGERLRAPGSTGGRGFLIFGGILILIGFWVLLANLGLRWLFFLSSWPATLIVLGGIFILLASRRSPPAQ